MAAVHRWDNVEPAVCPERTPLTYIRLLVFFLPRRTDSSYRTVLLYVHVGHVQGAYDDL